MEKLIKVLLPKGCFLLLTPEEYARALKRGKAIRRSKQLQNRTKGRDTSRETNV